MNKLILHIINWFIWFMLLNHILPSNKYCYISFALERRTHWVQPHSNWELIDYQWVRLYSKSRTQLYLKNEFVWIRLLNYPKFTILIEIFNRYFWVHWFEISSNYSVSHSWMFVKIASIILVKMLQNNV